MIVNHTLGVVLNGGGSRRMGQSKADLDYRDVRFIDHVLGTMSLVVSDIVISGGSYGGQLPVLTDEPEGVGPLGGLGAALRHAQGRPILVCAVDLPLISASALRRLVNPPTTGRRARIARARGSGRVQPLCGSYGPGVRADIDAYLAHGERSVLGLVERLSTEYVEIEDDVLTNVNTPEDLTELNP